jgi:hypothetical protein
MSILAVVVGLAVMREGSEIVLILQGLWADQSSTAPMLIGSFIGLGFGVVAGTLIYFGLLALSVSRLFALTNGLLVLIAAGMAAHAANFLNQADLLPALGTRLWDTSFILSDDSLTGKALGALVGYIARPSGIEVLFYVATVLTVLALIRITHLRHHVRAAAILLLATGAISFSHAARADEVQSPYVEEGEWELENEGIATLQDNNPANRSAKDIEQDYGYSPTSWYRAELETEFVRDAGPDQERIHYDSFNFLNTFQLAEPGEYWIDPGLYFEADFARNNEPNNLIFGVIGAKQIGNVLTTLNLFGQKEYGPGAVPIASFDYTDQTKYLWKLWLQPGFEVFGNTEGQTGLKNQQLATGPGIFGDLTPLLGLPPGNEIKYETSYLFGATPASPTMAIRWKIEYEFFF